MRLPPQDFLHECLDYDPDTGELTWTDRPRAHFTTVRVWRYWNARNAGRPALNFIEPSGYRSGVITVDGNTQEYPQHLVIWKLMTGEEPEVAIKHKNEQRADNRWDNLYLGTEPAVRPHSTGFKGVSRHGNKYRAVIYQDRRTRIYLGLYDTPELASAAYAAKAKELFGEFAQA